MAHNEEIEVIQHLFVFAVEIDGDELRVDVYGGHDCVCGALIYRFPDPGELADRVATLRRWRDQGTSVTYVRRNGSAALMDDLALLSDALD